MAKAKTGMCAQGEEPLDTALRLGLPDSVAVRPAYTHYWDRPYIEPAAAHVGIPICDAFLSSNK